jgi:hypothetical protein
MLGGGGAAEQGGIAQAQNSWLVVWRVMETLLEFWANQWNAYPDWLVVSAVAVLAVGVLWLLARFIAWLLKWVLIGVACTIVVGAVVYWIG